MRLRQNERCPIHKSLFSAAAVSKPKAGAGPGRQSSALTILTIREATERFDHPQK